MPQERSVPVDPPGDVTASVSVVGIGSSAGGLDALNDLLAGLTCTGRLAYVVAQHLSPQHPSRIVGLLTSSTSLRVVGAADGMVLEPDVIAIGPPRFDVTVSDGIVRLCEPRPGPGPNPSVDRLLLSIAESCGVHGAGVVLSGTGSDGANGLRAIKAVGGLTLVQEPETAKFDAMPRAAIALGVPDAVLAPAAMGAHLASLAGFEPDVLVTDLVPEPAVLATVLTSLQRCVGIDFTEYKDSTVQRQVSRRMAVRQITDLADYLAVLDGEPAEQSALVGNLLVTVTGFFRDPDAFDALRRHLTEYVRQRTASEPLRVWVPGCATGEEVYTVAMILDEALGHPEDLPRHLKVFGTDLDEGALTIARRGCYAPSSLEGIRTELVRRYFVEVPEGHEVIADLRECTVFARHNVGADPPFPRLDLVSFRNTCIYFTAPLQTRALNSVRFALLPGGLLFLGLSETIPPSVAGFTPVDGAHRIFARTAVPATTDVPRLSLGRWRRAPVRTGAAPRSPAQDSIPVQHLDLLQAVARAMAGPALILDPAHNVVEILGDVSAYCRLAEGRVSSLVEDLIRPELMAEARALILLTRIGSDPVVGKLIELDGVEEPVRMGTRPLAVGRDTLVLLTFSAGPVNPVDLEGRNVRFLSRDEGFDDALQRLEVELLLSQETLAQSMAELETTNEDLQASTEELQGSTEELQATNEELETTNEELQATNEELGGVNRQLRERGIELQGLLDDLQNVLTALTQGMVIVDEDLRVLRFSPAAVRVFSLVDTDIGQPLLTAPTSVDVSGLGPALRSAVSGLASPDLEFTGPSGTYLARAFPYQGTNSQRRGAILTLTDVTELVRVRRLAETALSDLTDVTEALAEVVWRRDAATLEPVFVSGLVEPLTGIPNAELRRRPGALDDCILADDRARVDLARRSGRATWSVQYRIRRRDEVTRDVLETGSVVHRTDGDIIVGTIVDISDRIAIAKTAADASAIFEAVFRDPLSGIAILDDEGRIVLANDKLGEILGRGVAVLVHQELYALVEPSSPIDGHGVEVRAGASGPKQARIVLPDGRVRWVITNVRDLDQKIGQAARIATVHDTTSLREAAEELSVQARHDALTGLANRNSIRASGEHGIARSKRAGTRLALAWIDLDKFKDINDKDGHDVGDAVLRTVAERLVDVVRDQDQVARVGGDEFAVLITDFHSLSEVESVLERILGALRLPIAAGDANCHLSGSVGVALYPTDGASLDELMRAADAAMYATKSQGGDAFTYFQQSMNEDAHTRRTMRASMASAIHEHAFELYYQPIVAADDDSVWGAEALLRLDQDGTLVTAADFIPFCEDSGQIRSLGPLTMQLLRDDLLRANTAGTVDLRVCLNLSVTQLEDRSLANEITVSGLAGLGNLVIEVTESVFLPGRARALGLLTVLRGLGAQISVDDFGTGFSNLQRLSALAPDVVKLDKSFLEGDTRPRDDTLIRAAIDMAHAIGAVVVAEGVETPQQRDRVTLLGTDLIQGYAVARSMPLAQLLTWIHEHQPQGPHPRVRE